MSEKMTCPVCDAHLSSVLLAYELGDPCPNCGTPAEVVAVVLRGRARGADADLVDRLGQMGRELGDLRRERDALRRALRAVEVALAESRSDLETLVP